MSIAGKKRTIAGITGLIVTACAVLLVFALHRLIQTETELATGSGESLLYALFQAHDEEQRLIMDAYDWNNGARQPEHAERLQLQIDLAISRLDVVSHGTLGRALADAKEDGVIESARLNLMTFDKSLQAVIMQEGALPQSLLDGLRTDAGKLKAASTRVFLAERDNIGTQRDRYSSVLWEAIIAILLILGCGVFIVARLLASLRTAAKAEDALRRDRDFSNLLLESSGDGVIAFDMDGRCTHWNSVMGEMFPAPGDADVIGQLIKDAYRLPEGHVILNMMRDTLVGQSLHMPAHPIPTGNRYVEKFTYPVWSGRAIVGGILFIRDVTDTHLARMQLVEHRDQLEATVKERTRDLEESLERETRLRELYKGFVSMVSHQFRTPLSIVDSSAQRMIRRGKDMSEEEIRERAGKIRMAILRLTRLVSSTLNATKLDAGEIDFAARRCDLGKLIVEACDRQKETTPNRQFRIELDQLSDWVSCDPLLIEQVVANLISNAVKYSSPPEPIDIRADVDERWIEIKVSDRGVGFPEDERDNLFDRFFRAKTAVGVEGTGIGLHVARTIARMHGGDVAAFQREGGGSTFVLRIPKEETLAA
ncbi:sensor histidine kinase [Paradevosia shaoguanensis]|uniref:histidine kinase n=1 Tax=Paradevosia shaoguanensis TaxID=1335043 RepID=A0AA41QMD3_9HYPH|nr:ATP-binding protein [Paradevosia shaoguanensis]MCF1743048.1 ATP-binding protein [Paradevosia shaoguanensis]MCI0127531.1 ATP-binding protein [Paradevosia shaoguanensis]